VILRRRATVLLFVALERAWATKAEARGGEMGARLTSRGKQMLAEGLGCGGQGSYRFWKIVFGYTQAEARCLRAIEIHSIFAGNNRREPVHNLCHPS